MSKVTDFVKGILDGKSGEEAFASISDLGFLSKPEMEYFEWVSKKGVKKRQAKWFFDALKSKEDRAKIRSKTFPGIARAIAEQWG